MDQARLEELLEKSDKDTITPKETLELLEYINSSVVALKGALGKEN